jgi:hypothetical protein
LFDARYRYTGIAVSKEFAALAADGIAPLIAAALLSGLDNSYWPVATYIKVLAGISFIYRRKRAVLKSAFDSQPHGISPGTMKRA